MAIQVVLPESGHTTQRRWPRHKIDVPVQVVTHGPANVVVIQGRGSELNCGGMSVFGRVELEIGAQIGVEFQPQALDNRSEFGALSGTANATTMAWNSLLRMIPITKASLRSSPL